MELLKIKKAVVTGGTGFLGVHLIEELTRNGTEVMAICRPDSGNRERLKDKAGVELIECDMDSIEKLPLLIAHRDCDAFFHLAWEGASGKLRTDYSIQQKNAVNCCNAAVAAKTLGCRKIIFTGTVYEKLCESIIGSDNFKTPAFYLLSKKYAYDMLSQLTKQIGLDFVWCTFFHPIGKYIKQEQMMAYAVACLLKGEQPAFGKAQEPYDIVAVEDIVYGLFLAGVTNLAKSKYYIGSGAPKRLFEYLERVQELVNPNVPLGIGVRPDDGLRFSFDWLDCSEFMTETGYNPRISFEKAVRNTKAWVMSKEEEC